MGGQSPHERRQSLLGGGYQHTGPSAGVTTALYIAWVGATQTLGSHRPSPAPTSHPLSPFSLPLLSAQHLNPQHRPISCARPAPPQHPAPTAPPAPITPIAQHRAASCTAPAPPAGSTHYPAPTAPLAPVTHGFPSTHNSAPMAPPACTHLLCRASSPSTPSPSSTHPSHAPRQVLQHPSPSPPAPITHGPPPAPRAPWDAPAACAAPGAAACRGAGGSGPGPR